jgi:DnaJ-class molecular chaperone
MDTEQAKVIPLPKYEECENCYGTGMINYPEKYINGDLYYDAEVLPCEECGGSGKIKIQEEE